MERISLKLSFLLLIVSLFASATLQAEDITTDTTLFVGDYSYSENLVVKNGATLTIENGAVLRFAANTGLEVEYGGKLLVQGVPGNPVLFTSDTLQAGAWNGLVFEGARTDDSEIVVEHAIIEYADKALYTRQSRVKANVSYTTVRHNNYGVYVDASYQNAPNHPYISFTNGALHNNAQHNYYTLNFNGSVVTRINATGNWWGTDDISLIANSIFDIDDGNSRPSIDFGGFLTSLGGSAYPGTHVTGYIVEDTTWDMIDGEMLGNVTVANGVTLTIAAGTQINTQDTTSLTVAAGGRLQIVGTDTAPVLFTNNSGVVGSWEGLIFQGTRTDSNDIRIDHAIIEYADKALYTRQSRMKASVSNSTVRFNNYGVYLDAAYQSGSNQPYITFSNGALHNNAIYNYYTQHFNGSVIARIDATGNWWGSSDIQEIANSIYDINDAGSRPSIIFSGYLAALNGPAVAGTHVMGYLAADTTWDMTDGVFLAPVIVPSGVTLTINPGTQISAKPNSLIRIAAGGKLNVAGTAETPVIFTGESATTGSWQGFVFEGSRTDASELIINHAIIEYADKALYTRSSRVKVAATNTTVRYDNYGVYVDARYQSGSNQPYITFRDGALHDNVNYNYYTQHFNGSVIARIDATGNWWGSADITQISASIFDINDGGSRPSIDFAGFLTGLDAPAYAGSHVMGYLDQDTTWSMTDGVMIGTVTVPNGVTLTIAPGTVISAQPNTGLIIAHGGKLHVQGTGLDPVLFTSTTTTPGSWQGITFQGSRTDGSELTLDHAIIEYADKALYTRSSRVKVTATNTTVRHNNYGVYVDAAYQSAANHPYITFQNGALHDNATYNYYTLNFNGSLITRIDATGNWWGNADVSQINNSIFDINDGGSRPLIDFGGFLSALDGTASPGTHLLGYINEDTVWNVSDGVVIGDVFVASGVTLNIAAGSQLAFMNDTKLEVSSSASLIVAGTATHPVLFTAANVSPVAGNWEGIRIRSSANLSMSHATIEFADNGVSFIGSRSNGLITNSQLTKNNIGVHVDAQYQALSNHPTPVINNSQLVNNINYQYYTRNFSSGSSRTLNARGNWWGSNDATTIAAGIYDNSDNSGLPHVDSGQFHYTDSEAAVLALTGSNLAYGTVSTEFSVALSNGAVINDTQWQQLSGPTVTLNAGSDAASVSFLSADVASDHTVSLSVTAQDENGIYSYAIIDIQLRPFAAFNSPPNVPDSLQQLVYSGDLVNVVMTATDNDPLTYQWTQTFGETVTLADNSSDTLSFTTPATRENMLLGFSLVVSDGTYDIQRDVTIGVKRQQDTAGTYYYHNDHLGTPQALTDNSQTVVWQASYTPFGEAAINTDIVENNIRFPGQYYDQESGLHYNYFRDYDPQSGRYIQSDRLGLFDGPNTYGYAHQNPISKYDPTGEFVPQAIGFLIGAGLEYLTNPCADTGDILLAGGMGAFGGFGANHGLKLLKHLKGSKLTKSVDKSWKDLIEGTAQKTHTPGHQFRSYREAIKMAKSGQYNKVRLNRAYSTTTGVKTTPRRLPDVIGVRKNGRIDAIEVPSRTDKPADLINRNLAAMKQLPPSMQGRVIIAPIN